MPKHSRGNSQDKLLDALSPPTDEHLQFTRKEVAQSEIESSIRLFFRFEDFVSAHLLASAATEILHQLSSSKIELTSKRALDKLLTDALGRDDAKTARQFLDLPYNFFKHSSPDLERKIHFRPEFTEVIIYSAAVDFRITFGQISPLMAAYISWFMGRHPKSFPALPEEATNLLKDMQLSNVSFKQAIADARHLFSGLI